jgi:ppGpp synthetase/RelA/SpoT-type nucleotidyltranferase
MAWKEVEYSRSQIINAGKIIKGEGAVDSDEMRESLHIIDNWRAAHAYPLHVIYVHLRRMVKSYSKVIVAERLKRLDSVISKLKREPKMNLWTMQDLGGCRVIVPNLDQVRMFADKYYNSSIRHMFKYDNDYILAPKISGYRSYHAIYQYRSDKKDTYNRNMLIELQFRTLLQHLWATAVETMGLFTNQSLKAGQGEQDVKRFFALISSLFALDENASVVPNTSDNSTTLIFELKILNEKHHFVDMLRAISVAVRQTEKATKDKIYKNGYYILILNYETKLLRM